jgi:1-acyl-sn-glycerol-3-phosphate acyltransferase
MKIFAKIKMLYAFFTTIIYLLLLTLMLILFRQYDIQLKKFFSKFGLFILGMRIKIKGEVDQKATMFIVNHQSALDINIIEAATKNQKLSWIAKQELFDLPILGRIMDLGHNVSIAREDRSGIVKLLKAVKKPLDMQRSLVIFPEGTRSRSQKMLKFKAGAKIIADRYNLKVQPIVVINSGYLFNIGDFTQKAGEVGVIFLKSFDAKKDDDWLNESRNKMKKVYEDELANNSSYR